MSRLLSMAENQQQRRRGGGGPGEPEDDAVQVQQQQSRDADLDSLLDEIDGVLETNAEEFVRSFVQKGGQ